MSGTSTMDKFSSDRAISTPGFEPWTRRSLNSASRGTIEENAKSSCLLCLAQDRDQHAGWDTAYVRATTKVLQLGEKSEALGAPLGGPHVTRAMMDASVQKANKARTAILSLDHPQTELVLLRLCADVSKVQYNLRLNGDVV